MTAERDLAAEIAHPKYAHVELERRWLANPRRLPRLDAMPFVRIEDRYLVSTRCRLRRMSRPDCDWQSLKLTRKYECADASARPIVTAYLSRDEFAVFATLPAHLVTKRRYRVAHDERWWSLDLFDGALAGLAILEIEAETASALASLAPPGFALREITHEPGWQGGALAARQTLPEMTWPAS